MHLPKVLCLALPCLAIMGDSTFGVDSRVNPPLPLQYFCTANPGQCTPHRDIKARWSLPLHATLEDVNAQVNAAIHPLANPRGGWKINPVYGDCNDYVLTKRSQLIEMGLPPGALRLAVTSTRRGEKHLILVVKTTAGDMVLDNLSLGVTTLRKSGYSIHSMSSANPRRWTSG